MEARESLQSTRREREHSNKYNNTSQSNIVTSLPGGPEEKMTGSWVRHTLRAPARLQEL